MNIIELTDPQAEYIDDQMAAFDDAHFPYKMEGEVRIGIEEDGRLIAGLDACITSFRILYISTLFVDAAFRRRGYGRRLLQEAEHRAKALGADTIRLDTFSWQGKEFYEAMGYQIVGHYENKEEGYSEYFFLKRI